MKSFLKKIVVDKKFRRARIWSNKELKKFSHLLQGNIINISAYKDEDKEGDYYRNYFQKCTSYKITNYDSDKKGETGIENEIYLDLEDKLPSNLKRKFNVVLNHTTLEHVYKVQQAFQNICEISSDYIVIVVPFLQEQHAFYGDYWRFTPLSLIKMCEDNAFSPIYISANDNKNESVYVFLIARRGQHEALNDSSNLIQCIKSDPNFFIGKKAIQNSIIFKIISRLKNF